MNKKTARRQRDLKSKLLAAVAMLLVSSMMMVTSTYAWFTLSTAPEVTGITTAVGANGNLEMALLPTTGSLAAITSGDNDSLKLPLQRNVTWGNLVDVSDNASYGMNYISLYPAALNGDGTTISLGENASPLKTPVYGADGRVSAVNANTTAGIFDVSKGQFVENLLYGVRAIGTSSTLTARELAHRSALGNAISNASGANTDASKTLNNNGAAISNIAIKVALGENDFTADEIAPLKTAIADLTKIADRIELALKYYLLANSIAPASAENTYVDIVNSVTQATSLTAAESVAGVIKPNDAVYETAKTKLAAMRTAITTASAINAMTNTTWDQLKTPLSALVDTSEITVNGMTMAQIQGAGTNSEDTITGKDELVNKIIADDFTAKMAVTTGGGVYADIADFTGSYYASFNVSVTYGGLTDVPVKAKMNINSDVTPSYLDQVKAKVATFVGAGSEGGANPISTFYGYVVDLAFRTNAAGSWLQLQQEAIDRIYEDGENSATMGHGANMTFKTDSATFGEAGVKELMKNIRIVFFKPLDGNKVIAHARLDHTNAVSSAAGVTMPIMLTDASGQAKADNKIMELTQNEAQALSVLVYLDGTTITNASVAADAAQSMYGSMNMQFSSSAELKPMDYADLKAEGGSSSASISPLNNIKLPGNGYRAQAYTDGSKIAFSLTPPTGVTLSDVKVKIGDAGEELTATTGEMGGLRGYVVNIPTGVTVDSNTKITITATETVASTPSESTGESTDGQ